jgi:hypothetical protein
MNTETQLGKARKVPTWTSASFGFEVISESAPQQNIALGNMPAKPILEHFQRGLCLGSVFNAVSTLEIDEFVALDADSSARFDYGYFSLCQSTGEVTLTHDEAPSAAKCRAYALARPPFVSLAHLCRHAWVASGPDASLHAPWTKRLTASIEAREAAEMAKGGG